MKAPGAKAGRNRFTKASGRLIAKHNGRQHIFAAGPDAFGERQRRGCQRRARMHDVAQVAIIGRRGIAQHGVASRDLRYRQFGAVAIPQRCVGAAALLQRQIADNPSGLDVRSVGRTCERAGDDHRRMPHRLRRQVLGPCSDEKLRQFTGNGHGCLLPVMRRSNPGPFRLPDAAIARTILPLRRRIGRQSAS